MDALLRGIEPDKTAQDVWAAIVTHITELYATSGVIEIIADCAEFDLSFIEERITKFVAYMTFTEEFGLRYRPSSSVSGRARVSRFDVSDMLKSIAPTDKTRIRDAASIEVSHTHMPADDAHNLILQYVHLSKFLRGQGW